MSHFNTDVTEELPIPAPVLSKAGSSLSTRRPTERFTTTALRRSRSRMTF